MSNDNKIEKLVVDDTAYETVLTPKYKSRKQYAPKDPKKVFAVIPGIVRETFVKRGDRVNLKQPVLLLEAMKMYNTIAAPVDGVVKNVHVQKGKMVAKGELLMEFE